MVNNNSHPQEGHGGPGIQPPGYPPPPYPPPQPPPYPDQPPPAYPPPPGWPDQAGYYPPPQAPKKKMSTAAIVAIILGVVVLLGVIAAAVYFFVLKDTKDPPTIPATNVTTPVSTKTTTPTTTRETEPEPTEPELSIYAERVFSLDPYEAQHLGANPVYYYQHPFMDIAIDLRGEEEAARMIYVYPTSTGFWVTHRQAISYEYGTLRDYPAGMDVAAIIVEIDLLSESEQQAEIADIITRRLQGEDVEVSWVPVKDGALYVRDNMSGGPDPAWYAKELYGSSIFFDHAYLSEHLVESVWPRPVPEQTLSDPAAEWDRIVSMLQNNPARFEWRYAMPPYSKDPAAGLNAPNWAFLEALITVPIYEYGTVDLNGDGVPEHLVHCCCDSLEEVERYGYWAVFTETPYGLRLIGFNNSGENDLIYWDDYFYYIEARGEYGHNSIFVEEHPIPVPSFDKRHLDYTAFFDLYTLINYEEEGNSLDDWKDWFLIPNYFKDEEGYEYLDYFVIDSAEFWGLISMLDEGLSGKATVVPIRTPYTVPAGEQVVELQDPYTVGSFVDYMSVRYHFFPFTEQDWMNAVLLEDVLNLGPPLTYDKVESLLPHPELIGQ